MRPSRVGAVVIVLALGAVTASAIGRQTPPEGTVPPVPKPATPEPASSAPGSDTTFATVAAIPTTIGVRGAVDVARGGLVAWGRFAVSSDLGDVAPWFWPAGPQWERFVEEAESQGVGLPAYSVLLTDEEVSEIDGEVVVTGRVVFARTGEASQSFRWRIILVADRGEWRIWTVEEAD